MQQDDQELCERPGTIHGLVDVCEGILAGPVSTHRDEDASGFALERPFSFQLPPHYRTNIQSCKGCKVFCILRTQPLSAEAHKDGPTNR